MRLFERETGGTYSDLWYRVAQTRPRLNSITTAVRQSSGEVVWYIIEDPAGSRYFRAGEGAYFFAGLLDGKRTVEDAWEACCAQLGDAAPTQQACIELLTRLQSFGLLLGDQIAAADMVSERIRNAKATRRQRRTGRWFFLSVPLINPEKTLSATAWLWKLVWSPVGLAIWLAVVGFAAYSVWANAGELADPLNELLTPSRLTLVGIVFLVLRAVHEFGHATACKALGGRCTEIGLFMVALVLPLPYCDATSSWRFPDRWRRIAVALGGVIFETFLAAIAAIVWANSSDTDGLAVRTVAYHVMLVSGVTTLIFNLNPLLRYDGYYILSDVLAAPNLAQRSRDIWKYLIERVAFGVQRSRAPMLRSRVEALWLMLYGLLSTPYRIFIALSIVLLVSQRFLTLGIVIAIGTATIMLVWPVLKGIWYLLSSPNLIGRRFRAGAIVTGVIGAVVFGLGFVPAPAGEITPATVEADEREVLRAPEESFIERYLVGPDEEVAVGDAIVLLRNYPLEAQVEELRAIERMTESQLLAAETESPLLAQAAQKKLSVVRRRLADAERRLASLTIRAGIAGRFVPGGGVTGSLERYEGIYIERGSVLGSVASLDGLVLRAYVSDREHAYLFRGQDASETPASVRLRGRAEYELPARVLRTSPVASREVGTESVTTLSGGEIEVTQGADGRTRTLSPIFEVELEPIDSERWAEAGGIRAGARGRVRFSAPDEPLGVQWWRRLQRYVSSRYSGGVL